ncbi:DNA-3-methyladenine glycosylase [Peptoniphilus stercorisuis]|uniref:Putative 3-methyladenine DNA glycosylase n=1 Tax=Peptoniphilus stercorisuis TaxID=1436965 RepID=A0ABS4KA66_9FIRM|nr:DNA-3-methyladenine glycosylase [Peptoniphilus stercorisuis]MBP2024669.1 DNA-3-methyladenine glycosylase [Peptoniphilus stercorisuis]
MKLDKSFYLKDTVEISKSLLGKILVRKTKDKTYKARIVETESYLGVEDKAAHTYKGKRTKRTETMFLEGGYCYVYFTYGMYNLLNIVTEEKDNPRAVLIRAVEPISNIDDFSISRYNLEYNKLNSYKKKNLTNGPGKLTMAMEIDRNLDKISILEDEIYIEDDNFKDFKIVEAKRVGIDYAEEWKDKLLRFYIEGNKYVSVK